MTRRSEVVLEGADVDEWLDGEFSDGLLDDGTEAAAPVDGVQSAFFERTQRWRDLYRGMPEFEQVDLRPWQSVQVHFDCRADRDAFAELVGTEITERTKSIRYPRQDHVRVQHLRWVSVQPELRQPKYPVYVISKGRWEAPLTSDYLTSMGVEHKVVVEPQERDLYAEAVGDDKLLVLPFSNMGQGSIPARNWVWDHSIESGAARHWILDDNIRYFYRLHRNRKIPVGDGTCFRVMEDFTDRFENVALSGPHYAMFAPAHRPLPAMVLNHRVYSCILIKNDLEFRWRGRYNEDTDLSLRALKAGYATVLFFGFLAHKMATMTMGGGNTDELYSEEGGRLKMAQSLVDQHPDVARIYHRWGRWQHYVDYRPFERNELVLREGVEVADGADNYGLELREVETEVQSELPVGSPAPAAAVELEAANQELEVAEEIEPEGEEKVEEEEADWWLS